MRSLNINLRRIPWTWWLALLLAVLLGLALWWWPAPPDALEAADQLFLAGRYHEALAAYAPLVAEDPVAALRVGMIQTLRGERAPAERALRTAMQHGLAPRDYHVGLLYLGRALADDGDGAMALRTWALTRACVDADSCVYTAPALVLQGNLAFQQGDDPAAALAYREALGLPLPSAWAEVARYGLALADATSDPRAGLARLDAALPAAAPADPWIAPLLPINAPVEQLRDVLQAEPAQQALLLGSIYLEAGRPDVALNYFRQVDPAGPDGLRAAAYAAYAQGLAGDPAGGLAQLEALATKHPDEAQLRLLLALSYVRSDAHDAAQAQLEALEVLEPNAPDLQIAWASWHAARREYDLASLAYDRALAATPREDWSGIALAAARFHLATTYELCSLGLPFGELAANERPDDATALATVAALRYHCGQFAEASVAARAALAAGAGPEATYYLGVALAAQGDPLARETLVRAADRAPASDWRRRAELALEQLR